MKNSAQHAQQSETNYLPPLSSQTKGWENILIEQLQPAPGEGTCHFNDEHTIFLSLAPRPVPMLHIQGGKTYTGMYGKGDICITPAKTPLFAAITRAEVIAPAINIRLSISEVSRKL